MEEIQKHLFELQDMAYRDFHSRLMPDTDKETIIGIRVPVLSKEYSWNRTVRKVYKRTSTPLLRGK